MHQPQLRRRDTARSSASGQTAPAAVGERNRRRSHRRCGFTANRRRQHLNYKQRRCGIEPLLDAGDAPGYHQPLSAGPPLYKAVDDEANDRPRYS